MTEQDNWLPQQLPEAGSTSGFLGEATPEQAWNGPGLSTPLPYDQPFGVGQPPPTFYSRRNMPDPQVPLLSQSLGKGPTLALDPSRGVSLSVIEGFARTWQKLLEHRLETLGFVGLVILIAVGLDLLLFGAVLEDPGPLTSEPGQVVVLSLMSGFLLQCWVLLCGAMALQASLEMMRGGQVRFLAFFRIVNPLPILALILSFGLVSAVLVTYLDHGVFVVGAVNFFAFLAMSRAIDHVDGSGAPLVSTLALFAMSPWQMTKMLVATVAINVIFSMMSPVLGGIADIMIFALMIAYTFRTAHGYDVR